jgi:DNA repair protein RadC
VHNHPSGHCHPSPEDKTLTEAINGVAQKMDLRLLDHIIVGRSGYFSFAEDKLLP